MSGLEIFNAHPRLYWGNSGYHDTPALFEIGVEGDAENATSWIAFGDHRFDTTGVLGKVTYRPNYGRLVEAIPGYLTLPTSAGQLFLARGWHFLMLYVLAFGLIAYWSYGIATGRFARTLIPDRDQLRPKSILQDIWRHLRLRRALGEEAARYNLLQRLSYIVVLFVLLPTMILTGMTMSASFLARFPWLIDLFNGRQSARTIHFIVAWLLMTFVLVHVFQVFVAGFVNEMRSMLTGWFRVREEK